MLAYFGCLNQYFSFEEKVMWESVVDIKWLVIDWFLEKSIWKSRNLFREEDDDEDEDEAE